MPLAGALATPGKTANCMLERDADNGGFNPYTQRNTTPYVIPEQQRAPARGAPTNFGSGKMHSFDGLQPLPPPNPVVLSSQRSVGSVPLPVGIITPGFHPELFIFNRFAVGNSRFILGLKWSKKDHFKPRMNR